MRYTTSHHELEFKESLVVEMTQNNLTFCTKIDTYIAHLVANPQLVTFLDLHSGTNTIQVLHSMFVHHTSGTLEIKVEGKFGGFGKSCQGTHAAICRNSAPYIYVLKYKSVEQRVHKGTLHHP